VAAKDKFHEAVRLALEKEQWVITADPQESTVGWEPRLFRAWGKADTSGFNRLSSLLTMMRVVDVALYRLSRNIPGSCEKIAVCPE
jgi:hypothetical protein